MTVSAGGAGGGGIGGIQSGAGADVSRPTSGATNRGAGGGGDGTSNSANQAGSGGSGIVILKYPDTFTISQSGLTLSTSSSSGFKITTVTAGTGTVSWT
jgi:hypothetical protein